MKFIWSAAGCRGVSSRIGSRPNTSSKTRLISHETGMAFSNDLARTRETGIDIQRRAKNGKENPMMMLMILVIVFGGALAAAAVTYTHASRKKRESIQLGEGRKFRL